MAQDRELVRDLAGRALGRQGEAFFAAVVNPEQPDEYRMPWCGRFSVPFGLLLLPRPPIARLPAPRGLPLALGAASTRHSSGRRASGGPTAPANLYHFVTQPAVAFVK